MKIKGAQDGQVLPHRFESNSYSYFSSVDNFSTLIKYGVILTTVYVYKWLLGDINVELAGHPYLCHENKHP